MTNPYRTGSYKTLRWQTLERFGDVPDKHCRNGRWIVNLGLAFFVSGFVTCFFGITVNFHPIDAQYCQSMSIQLVQESLPRTVHRVSAAC
jgi:hypothetical protein